MIRIGYMSDLHLEFERDELSQRRHLAGGGNWHMPVTSPEEAARQTIVGHPFLGPSLTEVKGKIDLMVLAGDIDFDHLGFDYAKEVAGYLGVPVAMVIGNHEGYRGYDLDLLIPELRAASAASSGKVHFLENDAVVLDLSGKRLHVLGCTLWTDYNLLGNPHTAMRDAALGLNDHGCIQFNGKIFSPSVAREMHFSSRQWLGQEIQRIRTAEGEQANILIVTHHAPHPDGAAAEYRGTRLSPAFESDLSQEILEWRPDAWIFGHTHFTCRLKIGDTSVLSAQRGYIFEPGARNFRPEIWEFEPR